MKRHHILTRAYELFVTRVAAVVCSVTVPVEAHAASIVTHKLGKFAPRRG